MNTEKSEARTAIVREVRLVIRGRVQGVGFRWWAREEAVRSGVRGSVRNREDGAVEVLARADAESMERFIERLRRGPPTAEVAELTVAEASGIPDQEFQIIR